MFHLVALTMALAQAPTDRPNIVFILADDLGHTDVASYGSAYYETPHLDAMAKQGMRFSHGYTAGPNCQPTRAALMSGQYGARTGVYTVGSTDRFDWTSRNLRPADNVTTLPASKVIVAQALKNAGYATGMFGKWHLGEQGQAHPGKRGFDEAIVTAGKHFDFGTNPKTAYPPGTYLADFLTDKAADFIRRNKARPFFLYLPHFGVHSPHQAKKELIEKFRPKKPSGGHRDPTYAAMLASVDESVGRLLTLLDELDLSKKTLVIFSSDNGGVGGYEREGIKGGSITDNAPLRGGKGMLYEGGVRVPYIFRWPGTIPAGSSSDQAIHSVDLYPTLLAVTATPPPASHPLDGVSYLGLLKTGGKEVLARKALFWHFPGYLGAAGGTWRTLPAGAVRAGDWKLIEFFEDNRVELYDVRNDVGQKKDLAADKPEKVKELRATLVAWRQSLKAPMPTPNVPGSIKPPKKKAGAQED